MRFPFVLLDAGETLIGPRTSFGEVYARTLGSLGIEADPAEMERALRATWERLVLEVPAGRDRYDFFPGGETGYWLRFVEGTLTSAGTGAAQVPELARRALDPLRDAFRDPGAWRVYPEVREVLVTLRELGARLAVVSNWDSRLPALLAALGLDDCVDAVTVSHLEGVEKPDPRIFRRGLERLGGTPDRAVHVGDRPDLDLEGARAAGIAGVLVDRRGRFGETHAPLRDLRPLPAIVTGARTLRTSTASGAP